MFCYSSSLKVLIFTSLATVRSFNPLAFITFCSVTIFDLYAVAVLITHAPRFRLINFTDAEKLLVRCGGVALLAGNWLYLLTTHL